ncbi:FAD-dependent oxidoreductase [Desulfatitalea alkaliphila]|uniref:FAD-dependent oxidoreductase n=1 Tax=Desulfatitalea alkaliphila TaxID=2929485 RepID=A0AA41R5Q8_9BACT|nr:FAD-dependent oxidoreductase [Desulfatitalea alkaliphila]MCJ8502296.1 FAD-dependent oxidoreductase [Desulfatitalea alkaliphila]
MSDHQRILIVGGVAGGASCAARCRRLSETAEIIMFDRGPHVSFANCGLPYYVGDVIKDEEHLLVATPEMFRQRFNIDVRLRSEVVRIDRERQLVEVNDLEQGAIYTEHYDALVLSPGARAIRPDMPGIQLPGIFSVRTIPDSRRIRQWIDQYEAREAVVVGGGYIGMEMVENLHKRGLAVTVVEKQPQVMPLLDPEMAAPIHESLIGQKVGLRLNEGVERFDPGEGHRLALTLASGGRLETDLVIMCIGVRPNIDLARAADLAIGESGGIQVDPHMRSSDPCIWAVGDAVEVRDVVTGATAVVPLAGPANRQGRIAADVIMGRQHGFRGVQGTSVVGVLGQVAAFTGASEKTLKRLGMWEQMEKIYLHPGHHAGYYPGAVPISLKLIFTKKGGRIVGAQAVGQAGVEKRIDVIAMAIQMHATVFDLEESELCYAPQFGSAKDPINMAGMIAANVLRGDASLAHWEDLEQSDALILDVRDVEEYNQDHLDDALHVPLDELRARMDALPRDREIRTYCFVGQRSYYAARALSQHGFTVKNISGGFKTYLMHESAKYL